MNSRKTLFLLVLVCLVGGFVIWDHRKGVSTDERIELSHRVADFDAKAVTHVELVRSNQTIVLDKVGDNWEIKQPIKARADFSAISEMLDQIEFADRKRTLSESDLQAATLNDFGLDPARATIQIQTKTATVTLRIGNETPTKEALYVQVDGHKRIHVAPKTLFDRASQGLDALRDRTVVELTPVAATRLEITSGGRTIAVSRSASTTNSEARWQMSLPLPARADQDKISELLADLDGAKVQDFVSDDPKDVHTYHLTEPEREVTVYSGDVGRTLVVGRSPTNDTSKVYAKMKGSDSIFTIPAVLAKKFAVQVSDLRDPRIFTISPEEVQSIEIARGADRITVKRQDPGWQLTEPLVLTADEAGVGRLLQDLAGLRVRQFTADVATDLDQFGLASPASMVTLQGAGTNILTRLLIGSVNTSNGVRFVKRSDEPFIYAVGTNAIDQLPGNYASLRSRVIFEAKPEQITKLTVGDITVSRTETNAWNLVAPAQGVLNIGAVNSVAGAFAHLRAGTFGRARTEQDGARGYTITATIGGTNQWVSFSQDGLAAASSSELAFTLPMPVIEVLSQKLVTVPATETNVSPAARP